MGDPVVVVPADLLANPEEGGLVVGIGRLPSGEQRILFSVPFRYPS
jgi:hypothetical protein